MYVVGASGDDVNEYDLSVAWDVSSAVYLQAFSVAAQENYPTGMFFKPDGTKMYVVGASGDDVNEYDIDIVFTLDAQPDVPRTLSGHFDAHAQITTYTIDIVGVDAKGNIVTEQKTEADGWDWETINAFGIITSIRMSGRTGTGVGDTMDIGITDVLGLTNIIFKTGDIFNIKKNDVNVAVIAEDISVVYDTYDMHTIGLAATDDFTICYMTVRII